MEPVSKIVVQSFQQGDGSNFTTWGVENTFKVGSGSLGVYNGLATNFNGQGTGNYIFDFKGSMPYGKSPVGGGFRVRTNLSENSQTIQYRLQPANVNIPVGERVNGYVTPYVLGKTNLQTGETKFNAGIFGGFSEKIDKNGKVRAFQEVQLYDVTKVSPETVSFNVGVSVTM